MGQAGVSLGMTDLFHRQVGAALSIPAKYYDLMRKEKPELLAANVNSWLADRDQSYMIRSMDGNARAFLSDHYRRIDNLEIAGATLPLFAGVEGVEVMSSEVTEHRLYLKIVDHRREVTCVGDRVQFGIVISNSEVGLGAVSVQPLVYTLACTNGMVVCSLGERKTHVGRTVRALEDNYSIYSDETMEAEDKAFLLKLRDVATAAFDEARQNMIVDRLTEAAGAKLKVAKSLDGTFQPDVESLSDLIDENTKGVILNSPNNPSGVVYTEENIVKICALLKQKSAEYDHHIFIISDEPYREIVYNGIKVPYLMNYYDDVVVCYSYSKSLSLPGERIGYIAVSPRAYKNRDLYAAVCGAGRALGYVCAPSLMQKVIAKCVRAKTDVEAYKNNRDLLLNSLESIGYTCVKPDGAFYLFVKALEADANAFSERAKHFGLLLVPGDSFGSCGYVRLAYCVSADMIKRSIPQFKELYNSYN